MLQNYRYTLRPKTALEHLNAIIIISGQIVYHFANQSLILLYKEQHIKRSAANCRFTTASRRC